MTNATFDPGTTIELWRDLFATNETLELAAIDSSLEKSAVPEINQTNVTFQEIFGDWNLFASIYTLEI